MFHLSCRFYRLVGQLTVNCLDTVIEDALYKERREHNDAKKCKLIRMVIQMGTESKNLLFLLSNRSVKKKDVCVYAGNGGN